MSPANRCGAHAEFSSIILAAYLLHCLGLDFQIPVMLCDV